MPGRAPRMIVQPEPANRPGRRRRLLHDAGLAAPVLLIFGVAIVGLLGQQPAPPDASVPPASQAAVAEPGDEEDGSPGPAPSWVPSEAPSFPGEVAGLPVLTVPDALAQLDAEGDRPVAIAGWLGALRKPLACPLAMGDTRDVLSPLCERRARLVVADPGAANPSAHFHVTLPPGVPLPPAFEHPDTASTAVAPVILVGRST